MKIAIFSDTFFPQVNGVAGVAYGSAEALVERGHDIVVFVPSSKINRTAVRDSGKFKVVFLPSLPSFVYTDERIVMPFSWAATRYLRKFQPDIIHSHTPFGSGWSAYFAAKILKVKVVTTHHTFFDDYLKHIYSDYRWSRKLSWKFVVWYCNLCDIVISPSIFLSNMLVKHGLLTKMEVVINPVDTIMFFPLPPERKIELKKIYNTKERSIVYMGRLSYEKSVDIVVRAFASVLDKKPSASLMIVGDGPERGILEKLCSDLDIKNHVVFTGVLRGKKLAEAVGSNEVFVTASKSENMPLSVLEAEAAGLPIVAVSEKGLIEMVKNGVNGMLVPADDVSAMADAIIKILYDDELLRNMSISSRSNSEEFSKAKVTEILENSYRRTLNG